MVFKEISNSLDPTENEVLEKFPLPQVSARAYDKAVQQGNLLAIGGYAKVYNATVPSLAKQAKCVVKVIEPQIGPKDDREPLYRAAYEFMAQRTALNAPGDGKKHIVRVYDACLVWSKGKMPFVAILMEPMKFSLDNAPAACKFDRQWVLQCLQGLKHIHALGMVHRDLYNRNIMIGYDNVAKISDFGFACWKEVGGSRVCGGFKKLDPGGPREWEAPATKDFDLYCLASAFLKRLVTCRSDDSALVVKLLIVQQAIGATLPRKYVTEHKIPPIPTAASVLDDLRQKH